MAAVTGVVLTMLPPGGTIAVAEGAYYGHTQLFDHLRPWGIERRRVRPDRVTPRRCRPDPDRGPVEPDADDAGLRGGSRAPGACDLRRHARLPASPASPRARMRRLAAQCDEGPRRSRRPARGDRQRHATTRSSTVFTAPAISRASSRRPTRPGCSSEGCRRPRYDSTGWRPPRRCLPGGSPSTRP